MIAAGLVAGVVALAPQAQGGGSIVLSGQVLGEVLNNTGAPQMGAAVFLYNRYDKLISQALTNESGKFIFDGLTPDIYSIRVNLASFLPAVRSNIAVAPGSENLLRVNLGTLFSGVELAPPGAIQGALMSDDWKWVLRTSAATRPILRLVPVSSSGSSSSSHHHMNATFTETTGVVKLSSGDSGPLAGTGSQDVGTAFAVSTRINGVSRMQLSGDFAYLADSGLPTAAFRATYSHDEDGQPGPQMSLTMHQIYFPGVGPGGNFVTGSAATGVEAGPALRTVSLSAADRVQVNDSLQLEYGAHVDSVAFGRDQTRWSPHARATYDLGESGSLLLAFSAGTDPAELHTHDPGLRNGETGNPDLNQDLAALSMLPAISRDGGQIRMERARNFEAGYQLVKGSRKYYAAAYSQAVTDAAFNMSAPPLFQTHADLLPALDGSYYVFDLGEYQRAGYVAAVTQALGDHAEFTLGAGRTGDLMANPTEAAGSSAGDVRSEIHAAQRSFAMARISALIPGLGMRIATSYGWTPLNALMPTYYSLTGPVNQEQGLNIAVHQPIPHFGGGRGRLEATGELRNALAEGYLPVTAGGHCSVLTDSPRSLRAGLSFLF